MSLAAFTFTDRVRPVVQIGAGDYRVASYGAAWDVHRWDDPAAVWAGTEPLWFDVTCNVRSYRCEYGRRRTTDRFVVGAASVVVDNGSGWADISSEPAPNELTVRPGRPVRLGVDHAVHGIRWLFRGFVDAMTPTYHPTDRDTVELFCIDALGEVNRAKLLPSPSPIGAGHTVDQRIGWLLDLAKWPPEKRSLEVTSDVLIPHDMGGQVADLVGQAADSGGGSVFGDREGRIAYRHRDWQAFSGDDPVDGTIGNVDPGDVCPTQWERPFARADIATRVIVGRGSLSTGEPIRRSSSSRTSPTMPGPDDV